MASHGKPANILSDNGTEVTSRAMCSWAQEQGVHLHCFEPGKPVQHAFHESFNGRLRDECLNASVFHNIRHARVVIESWRQHDNQARRHSSLGYLTPDEYWQQLEQVA